MTTDPLVNAIKTAERMRTLATVRDLIEQVRGDYPETGLMMHYHHGAEAALNRLKKRIDELFPTETTGLGENWPKRPPSVPLDHNEDKP